MLLDFAINHNEKTDSPVINLKGEIDIYTSPKLKNVLTDLINTGKSQIYLNFKEVQYIDSTGLGTIVQSANLLEHNKGKLHITSAKPTIKKVFEVSGVINKDLIVFEDELSIN